jgi:hypothetical protein
MKTRILPSLLIAMTVFASSCLIGGSDSTTGQVVTSGTWKVTLFTDSGNDETSDFAGYTFTFSDAGTLTALKNGVTKTGTWSVNNSSNKFNIDLGPKVDTNKPLGELTDDWKIISNTETVIRLTDDNASSNEFLTFTKN